MLGLTECWLYGSSLTLKAAKSGKHHYCKCSIKIHWSAAQCASKDLPTEVLEKCIHDLLGSIITDDEFFEAIYDQIKFNKLEEIEKLYEDFKKSRSNKTRFEREKTNLLNTIKKGSKPGAIKSIEEDLEKIESQIGFLINQINALERKQSLAVNQKINKQILKKYYLNTSIFILLYLQMKK